MVSKNVGGPLQAFSNYELVDTCTNVLLAYGSNPIPVGSVVGEARNAVPLNVNTATVPGTWYGTPIALNIKWTAIPGDFYNGSSTGTSQVGNVRNKSTGSYEQQTTKLTGTVTGVDLTAGPVSSYMGWGKNKYVTITKNAAIALGSKVAPVQ